MNKKNVLLIAAAALLFASPVLTLADSNSDRATRSFKRIRSELKILKKLARKKGVSQKLAALGASARELKDSDNDDLPDILEGVQNTNACSSDSDDDGISDGDESDSGSNPNNDSSGEVELTSTISALTSNTITVGNYTCTANESTVYRDGSSLSFYAVGNKVEVKCRKSGGILYLTRIKLED
jgi:hypothetical protein